MDSVSSCETSKQQIVQKTGKLINPLKSNLTEEESEFNNNEICMDICITPEICEPKWDFTDSLKGSKIPTNTSNSINNSIIHSPNRSNNINRKYFNFNSSITVILDDYILQKQQNHCKNQENINFIHNYIHNDKKCIFDEYISQINDETDSKNIPKPNLRLNLQKLSNLNIAQIGILCSNGWNIGQHEWIFKILQCDNNRQEIGIISISDIKDLKMNRKGIRYTKSFGARALYGSSANVLSITSYYASYNNDGTERCYKDLNGNDKILWSIGDVIKVCINLDQYRIKFYVNDVKIRKTLSLEMGYTYYPIVMFYGK
eukprot:490536_1